MQCISVSLLNVCRVCSTEKTEWPNDVGVVNNYKRLSLSIFLNYLTRKVVSWCVGLVRIRRWWVGTTLNRLNLINFHYLKTSRVPGEYAAYFRVLWIPNSALTIIELADQIP